MAVHPVQLPRKKGTRKHEQRMWEEFTGKIQDEWGKDEKDIYILGSVDIDGLECDCILITSNCLCIIDFKAHEGEIELRDDEGDPLAQFDTNALWYLKGKARPVKGGSQGTPFLQIERSKWKLKERIEELNENVPLIDLDDFTNPSGVVLFSGNTRFPYTIPKGHKDGKDKWFHVTNMDSVIGLIKDIERKARLGLANEEIKAIRQKMAYGQDAPWKKCTPKRFARPHTGPAKASQSDTKRATPRSESPPTPPRTPGGSARPRTGAAKASQSDTKRATRSDGRPKDRGIESVTRHRALRLLEVWPVLFYILFPIFFSIFWWHRTIGHMFMSLSPEGNSLGLHELSRFIYDNSLDYGAHLLWNGSINTWSLLWFVVLIISIPTSIIVPMLFLMYCAILLMLAILLLCAAAIYYVVVYFIENPY